MKILVVSLTLDSTRRKGKMSNESDRLDLLPLEDKREDLLLSTDDDLIGLGGLVAWNKD